MLILKLKADPEVSIFIVSHFHDFLPLFLQNVDVKFKIKNAQNEIISIGLDQVS